MTLRNTARAVLLPLLLCWSVLAAAQLPVPALTARVTDQTATLTAEQKAALERTLESFEARKGSQIAILMVPTTAPETVEQFALRVAEQWKLGRKKIDDGALLLIAKNDRALRIEVGYGLEGALNDATSKRIISEIIVPRFQQGDFYGGIQAGVDRIIRVVDGEPLPPPQARRSGAASAASGDDGLGSYLPIVFLLALVVGGVLRAVLGRFIGAMATGGALGMLAWWFAGTIFIGALAGVIAFFITLLGGGRGGFIPGGFGGGSGGFGGGGFGGGGGTFGGGGASGRW